jgi:LCP family protein required for cell wall assembly
MSSGGRNDGGRDDSRYDWLYGGQGGQGGSDDPYNDPYGQGGGEPTQVMPTGGGGRRRAGGYPPPGQGYPPQQGYPPPQQGYPPQGYPQQGYPGQGYPGQGQPPGQGYPPGGRPPGPPVEPMRRPRPPRRRGGVRWLRIILLVLLAYVVFLVAMPFVGWGRVERVDISGGSDRPPDTPGTTYLIVGSDSREGLTDEEKRELGTGSAGGQRTDSIMILHVPSAGVPVLISIPRDSYVPIPGKGRNKINAAFAFGGAPLLAETVENATGLRMDEYVEIGFGGFASVVNAVDGVEICVEKPIKDEDAHIDLPAGCQNLQAADALGYVRARKFDSKGDLGRVERQQQFLSALTKKAISPGTILNPIRYASFCLAVGDAITAGQDTGVIDMARFALAMRAVSAGAGVSLTVPTTPYTTPGGSSALKWKSDEAKALFNALGEGNPVPPDLIPSPKPSPDSGN